MGMSCLLTDKVSGCNRDPFPPAKTIPFIDFFDVNIGQDSVLLLSLRLFRKKLLVATLVLF